MKPLINDIPVNGGILVGQDVAKTSKGSKPSSEIGWRYAQLTHTQDSFVIALRFLRLLNADNAVADVYTPLSRNFEITLDDISEIGILRKSSRALS